MILTLVRKIFTEESTIGHLSVNGEFECYTLEDRVRAKKVHGKTAIPMGHYEVLITHSKRFNRQMPLLLNVPNYAGVRIHPGNTAAHTEGCILVGKQKGSNHIGGSRLAYRALFRKLNRALKKNEKVYLTIHGGYATT